MNYVVPEAVVFDLGKVLVDFDYGIAARNLCPACTVDESRVRQVIDASPLLHEFEHGDFDQHEFHRRVCAATGYAGTLPEFSRCFADIFTEIAPMVELHAALRQQGLPTYVFSNTNELAVPHIREHFPFFGEFTGYILSYEHRAMKPSAQLYEVVEQRSGLRSRHLLYVDDRWENVAAGAARGWQVIHHQEPALTRAVFRDLGLLPK